MASEPHNVSDGDGKPVSEVAGVEQAAALSSGSSKAGETATASTPVEETGDTDTSTARASTARQASPASDTSGRSTPTSAAPAAVVQPPQPAAAPAQPASAATPHQQHPHHESNDAVSALQAMFPSMDATIISEVLAAHGGDADAASMALLELNNPAPPSQAARNTGPGGDADARARTAAAQLKADEEYARQLMMQMEREHQQEYGRPLGSAPTAQQQQQSQVDYNQLNYVPRQRNRHGQPAGGGRHSASLQQQQHDGQYGDGQQGPLGQWLGGQTGPDGRWKHQDELDQLTEQFNKFADTGKKTFNSFLSKAKDKYAQTAQQRALYAQSSQQQQGANESSSGFKLGGLKLPNIPSPWQGGTGFRPGEKPMSPEREELRSGPYHGEARSSVMRDYSSSPSRPSASSNSRNSFDDDAPPIQINKPLPAPSTQFQAIRTASSTNAPALSSSPATASPGFSTSPPHLAQTQSRSSFTSGSPAKVQMLPRQTINLFDQSDKDRNGVGRSGSPAVAGGAAGAAAGGAAGASSMDVNRRERGYDDDSDSDVEYVRNPFNDDD